MFVKKNKKLELQNPLYIQSYCKITVNQVLLNGQVVFEDTSGDTKDFLKNLYAYLGLKYSKFFKMDNLSKLSFLASEIVLEASKIKIKDNNIAIVFSNNASSLETDRKHQNSINNKADYFPSPAIFVYTLPNIGIGEISIRHQLKSENAFFVFNNYNAKFHYVYENGLVQSNKADAVLGGWTNVDEGHYEAFVYLVSNKKTDRIHTEENLNILYH